MKPSGNEGSRPGLGAKRSGRDGTWTTAADGAGVRILQNCPVCGRWVRIQIDYLGLRVSCRHCGGTFTASADSPRPGDAPDERGSILQRAGRWLAASGP